MMKTNDLRYIVKWTLYSLVIVLLSSCSRYYYQPNAVNVPMLKDKNDANIGFNGSYSAGEIFETNRDRRTVLNFHGAYSPIKYVGLMTTFSNYVYTLDEQDPATGEVNARATLFEGGIGGYYPIFERSNGLALIADGYVGYGGGYLNSDVKMDFSRLFFQPGIHMRFPYVDVGITMRYSGMKYSNFDAKDMSAEYIEQQKLTHITDGRHSFFEPTFTVRGGYKFIKGQFQMVGSSPMNNIDWNANRSLFTVGIFFSIDELIKFKNK